MNLLYLIIFMIFGFIFGSFFGVVGSRLSEGKSIINPASHCEYCNHILKWYELIPIFSYIIQKGKCRNCGHELSIFYLVIELISGFLFAFCFAIFGFSSDLLIALLIVSYLCVVIVSDINYLIIPDEVTLFFSIIMIFVKLVIYGIKVTFFSILSGALLFSVMYIIMLLGNKIFKKETLGGADIKLMFFVGIILTPSLGLFNIFLASCLALPISLILMFKNKNNIIPFGPFLILSTFIIFCLN